MSEELHYLRRDSKDMDNVIIGEERLFRRFKPTGINDPKDGFLTIRTTDLIEGVSVNRSKYCLNPNHTLWSIQDVDPPMCCEYIQKEGAVCAARVDEFPRVHQCTNSLIQVELVYRHSPEFCNYSHSLIVLSEVPESKKDKIDLKIVLSELFSEIV